MEVLRNLVVDDRPFRCDNAAMIKRIFAVVVILSLTACIGVPAPTQPVPTETGAATIAPTIAPEQPTATVTVAQTGPALEAIVILQPGVDSAVTSPLTVQGQSRPTFEQNLVVAVFGEDGSVLAKQPTTLDSPAGNPGNFNIDILFNVDHEQPGRVAVYETSAMDGGIVHLTSVAVTLDSGTAAEINPPHLGFESIEIQSPVPMAEISGGTILVSGYSDYFFESNLGLMLCGGGGSGAQNDLCGTDDNILASGNATIDAPDVGLPGPFSGELAYSVSEPTPARIVVFAASPRDGGWLHVSSIPILLSP